MPAKKKKLKRTVVGSPAKAGSLPKCRCATCQQTYRQPHSRWFSLDCPACEKKRAPCECHHPKSKHRGACQVPGCECSKYTDRKLADAAS